MIVGRVSRRAERSGRLTVGGPLGRPRYSPTNCGQITLRSAGPLYPAVHDDAAAATAAAQSVGRLGHGPHQDAEPHNSGGCGSNAPHLHAGPPPRRGIKYAASARPLPRRPRLLSPASTAAGSSQPLDDLVVSLSPLCRLAAAASRRREDEGHGRVPERPGGRQGRHRPQGLGTLCSLPPASPPPWGLGLLLSGEVRFSSGVRDLSQRLHLGFISIRGFFFAGQGRGPAGGHPCQE
jgi:hypothetical protein